MREAKVTLRETAQSFTRDEILLADLYTVGIFQEVRPILVGAAVAIVVALPALPRVGQVARLLVLLMFLVAGAIVLVRLRKKQMSRNVVVALMNRPGFDGD